MRLTSQLWWVSDNIQLFYQMHFLYHLNWLLYPHHTIVLTIEVTSMNSLNSFSCALVRARSPLWTYGTISCGVVCFNGIIDPWNSANRFTMATCVFSHCLYASTMSVRSFPTLSLCPTLSLSQRKLVIILLNAVKWSVCTLHGSTLKYSPKCRSMNSMISIWDKICTHINSHLTFSCDITICLPIIRRHKLRGPAISAPTLFTPVRVRVSARWLKQNRKKNIVELFCV